MSTANASFDRVASTTLKNYTKQLADNISSHIPTLGVMRAKGAVRKSGGDTIVMPIVHEFANAQSYSGSDVIDITKQDGVSAAEYNWRQTVVPVIIEGIEQARNAGESKQLDIMEAVMTQAELALENKVSEMIMGDGTGNGGKDMLGLEAIIAQDPTTGTLGGINSANEAFWRNETDTATTFSTGGLTEMGLNVRTTQRGTDRTDLIVMDATNYGRLETVANGRAEFSNPKLADLGFAGLKFQGIDVIFDQNSTDDRIYGLNTRWLKLYIHKDNDFVSGDFIEPANQDIIVAKIKLYAQLVTNRRESLWVMSGIS